MSLAPDPLRIGLGRLFTSQGVDPYDEVVWERRDARITNLADGSVAFEQTGVEFPADWSQNATNIVAQKYFRGHLGTPERESSLRQVVDRVVDTITRWGLEGGYFSDDAEASAFSDELKYILVTQRAAFNSPVWFNIGVPGVPQQGVSVLHPRGRRHDGLDPQLVPRGGDHLQGRVRRRHQPVEDPLQRRAPQRRRHGVRPGELHARRRRLGRHDQVRRQDPSRRQDGHPQRRSPRHRGVHLVQGARGAQGAGAQRRRLRHGPRRPRRLLGAVPERQQLGARHRRVHAGRRLRRRLGPHGRHHRRGRRAPSRPATCGARSPRPPWECADPGMQFDTTINRWHTAANTGRIDASNPC